MKITIEQIVIYALLAFTIAVLFNTDKDILNMFSDLIKILISGYIGYLTKSLED